ncbi:pyridoxamine 5'-phosphate oxidase family protein [Tepidamorphus sp. 3E244]|uniref:pyridoxamine 5'-phosphate oxidase family protein n=1 Tax=Tepidamorphus sp. 3E244 TaxID=3385498 RepID=UPI0038FC905B
MKKAQAANGSREAMERFTQKRPWASRLTPDIAAFVEDRDSAFLGTANLQGQPDIQHGGGPSGFLHVLDECTIGFADLAGNRQYVTVGNLSENPSAFLFLIDYASRVRVKIWGRAKVVEDDPALIEQLKPQTPLCRKVNRCWIGLIENGRSRKTSFYLSDLVCGSMGQTRREQRAWRG